MKIYNSKKKNLVFCMLTKCLGFAFCISSAPWVIEFISSNFTEGNKGLRRGVVAQGDPKPGPRASLPGHYRSQPFKDTWQGN